MGQIWVVRAGKEGRLTDKFLQQGKIVIFFNDTTTDDLSGYDAQTLPGHLAGASNRNASGQLVKFAYLMQVGDTVLMPLKTSTDLIAVGEIKSDYEHLLVPVDGGVHSRDVSWTGFLRRSSLSPAGINTFGSLLTVFSPSAVEAELRNLLTSPLPPSTHTQSASSPRAPRSSAAPVAQPGASSSPGGLVTNATAGTTAASSSLPDINLELEVILGARGRATVRCDHPALVMQQVPRQVDPDAAWRDVPGIYVLTGTELQQSTSRTGHERTLTMTSIVKPWAYVGLSESFFNRLSTHRGMKPEWRRALLVRSGAKPFSSDDLKYLEARIYEVLQGTDEVLLDQSRPNGNTSAQPRNPAFLDLCADAVVAVLRLTGTLI